MFTYEHYMTDVQCSKYHTNAHFSQVSKVILKILQPKLQQWMMNFQMFKLDLEKPEEPDQRANIQWIIEKARELQ